MIIAAQYSFNGGQEFIADQFPNLLHEIKACI